MARIRKVFLYRGVWVNRVVKFVFFSIESLVKDNKKKCYKKCLKKRSEYQINSFVYKFKRRHHQ